MSEGPGHPSFTLTALCSGLFLLWTMQGPVTLAVLPHQSCCPSCSCPPRWAGCSRGCCCNPSLGYAWHPAASLRGWQLKDGLWTDQTSDSFHQTPPRNERGKGWQCILFWDRVGCHQCWSLCLFMRGLPARNCCVFLQVHPQAHSTPALSCPARSCSLLSSPKGEFVRHREENCSLCIAALTVLPGVGNLW